MDKSEDRARRQFFMQRLLGIDRRGSQQPTPRGLKIADIVCAILVSIGLGYLATLQAFDSLPLNADALAPFEEAKSLISNPDTHLFNIHVSRIASIFPDLTLNTLLQGILPKAGFLEIFSYYAWFISSTFLILATLLTNEIKQGKQLLTPKSIKLGLITVSLLNISHEFNIIYAHLITPVHHGGNIINTLLILTLAIRSIRLQRSSGIQALLIGMIVLATLSNKMVIFTAILPSATIYILYEKGVERRNKLISIIISTLIGIFVSGLFNQQCASPEFNLLGTMSAFRQYFQISWITSASTLLSIGSIIYVIKKRARESELPQQTAAGLVAISISSLSYFIYLPMLTSSGEAPLRYLCVAYALITVFICFYIIQIEKENRAMIVLSLLVVLTIVSFQYPDRPAINIGKHQSLKQQILDRSDLIEPFKNDAATFINKMGYNSYLGLGDYWMSGATLATNSKMHIVPIHYTGIPDFWGATPQDIRRQIKYLNNTKAYLLTEDDTFKKEFEKKYGDPSTTWNYSSEDRKFTKEPIKTSNRLQIYDNPEIYNQVRKYSKRFKRQCDPSKPKYKVR